MTITKKSINIMERYGIFLLFMLVFSLPGYAVVTNISTMTPYPDIQSAIDAATPGQTIYVYPGTYAEALEVYSKTDIDIIAWDFIANGNNTSTIINASGEGFDIRGSTQITIQGFTINTTSEAIEFASSTSSYIDILDNVLDNCGYGVRWSEVANNVNVLRNSINNAGTRAIYMNDGGSDCVIADNSIIGAGDYGIQATTTGTKDNIIISGNTINGTGGTGVRIDIGNYWIISNNTISANTGRGLQVADSAVCAEFIITHNYISDNGEQGITYHTPGTSGRVVIAFNVIIRNGGSADTGLEYGDGGAPLAASLIYSNYVVSNGRYGIYVMGNRSGPGQHYIVSNEVGYNLNAGNDGSGGNVYVRDVYNGYILRNLIYHGPSRGVHLEDVTNLNVINNVIAHHTMDGIDVDNQSITVLDVRILNNIIMSNQRRGAEYDSDAGTQRIFLDYNLFYMNGTNIKNLIVSNGWDGPSNVQYTAPALLYLDDKYIPISTNSPAWDKGTNSYLTLPFDNNSMDIGYREYFEDLIPPWAYITNVVTDQFISGIFSFMGTNADRMPGTGVMFTSLMISNDSGMVYSNQVSSPSPAFSHSVNIDAISSGYAWVYLYTEDYVGLNFYSPPIRFQIPFQPPVIAETGTVADTYINGVHNFAGYASNVDPNPVLDPVIVYLQIDGGPITSNGLGNNFSFNYDTAVLTDGLHVFRFIAVNQQGLSNDYIQTNTVDNSAPVLVITNPAAAVSIMGTSRFAGTNFDSTSLITGFWYTLDGGGSWLPAAATNLDWAIDIDTTALPNGSLVFGVRSSNEMGLVSIAYITNLVANVAPLLIEETVTTNGSYLSGMHDFIGYASNADPFFDPVNVFISTNGGPAMYFAPGGHWTNAFDTTLLPDGPNTITFSATNNFPVTSFYNLNVTVDNSAPDLNITSPVAGAMLSNSVIFSGGNQEPHSLITGFWYSTNSGSSWEPAGATNASWSIGIDTTMFNDGVFNFMVMSSNIVGLTSVTNVSVMLVNYSDLYIAETNVSNATYFPYISGTNFIFTGYTSNMITNYDPISLYFSVNSGTNVPVGTGFGSGNEVWNWGIDTTQYADGPNAFHFTAVNANGVSNTFTVNLTVDNSPPAAALNVDISGAGLYDAVPLVLDRSDPHSGIIHETVLLSNHSTGAVSSSINLSPFDTTTYNNGSYSLIIILTNGAGLGSERVYDFSINNLEFRVMVGPNPCDANVYDSIKIQGVTWNSQVKIYSVNGHLIRMYSDMHSIWQESGATHGTIEWDLANTSGEKVASGVYIILVTENAVLDTEPEHIKVSVIRD